MSNCMGKRRVKKMATGGKPNLEALGDPPTPPVNVKQEKKKRLRKKRYEVEKDMPARKLADMADRARRRATGSQAKMQEMGSVTKPRTAKSKLKRRFGADTSKEDYGRNASGGSVKKMAKGGFPDLNKDGKVTKKDILMGRGVKMATGGKVKGRRGDGVCLRGRTKGRMV